LNFKNNQIPVKIVRNINNFDTDPALIPIAFNPIAVGDPLGATPLKNPLRIGPNPFNIIFSPKFF